MPASASDCCTASTPKSHRDEKKLTRKDLPYTLGMILLDFAAPILLMLGLKSASSANASLLGNFEIVATTLIALLLFREKVSKRLCVRPRHPPGH